jgi:hypothetical protein
MPFTAIVAVLDYAYFPLKQQVNRYSLKVARFAVEKPA